MWTKQPEPADEDPGNDDEVTNLVRDRHRAPGFDDDGWQRHNLQHYISAEIELFVLSGGPDELP